MKAKPKKDADWGRRRIKGLLGQEKKLWNKVQETKKGTDKFWRVVRDLDRVVTLRIEVEAILKRTP